MGASTDRRTEADARRRGGEPLRLCPYDLTDIATCPGNEPVQLPVAHRSRITCRYFEVRATARGMRAVCTRTPD